MRWMVYARVEKCKKNYFAFFVKTRNLMWFMQKNMLIVQKITENREKLQFFCNFPHFLQKNCYQLFLTAIFGIKIAICSYISCHFCDFYRGMYLINVINPICDNSFYAIFPWFNKTPLFLLIACDKYAKNEMKLRNAKIIAHTAKQGILYFTYQLQEYECETRIPVKWIG